MQAELEWVRANPKGRQAKSKARIARFEELSSQEFQKRAETQELYIPAGQRLGDIVIELNNSLDFEVGGDIAKELSSLYDYMLFASTQANIKIDAEPLQGCLSVLNTLYEGWSEAIKSLKAAGAPVVGTEEVKK